MAKGNSKPITPLETYTIEEVRKHDTPESCWIVIEDLVYDVTTWVPKHPGGDIIYKFAGRDVTDLFHAFHLPHTETKRLCYLIGKLDQPRPVNGMQRDCRALRKQLIREDMFTSSTSYYILDNLYCLALFLIVVAVHTFSVYWGNDSWVGGPTAALVVRMFFGGALMGFFWHQVGALLHDSLHSGIAHNINYDDMMGWLYGCVCFGISSQWWKNNHNKHHAYPNCLNPDGTIADQQQDVRPFFVQYPTVKPYVKDFYERWFIRIQHLTFIPIVWFVGRYAILVDSYVHRAKKYGNWELIGLFLHWAWVYFCIRNAGPSWIHVGLAYAIAAVFEGVLHLQLEMNHFCKPMLQLDECRDTIDFYTFQCITSRNVRLVIPFEWRLHGGLHKQIEHHMFPLLPRHNLHKITDKVRDICKKNNVPYDSKHTFPGAIWTVCKNLYTIGWEPNPKVQD